MGGPKSSCLKRILQLRFWLSIAARWLAKTWASAHWSRFEAPLPVTSARYITTLQILSQTPEETLKALNYAEGKEELQGSSLSQRNQATANHRRSSLSDITQRANQPPGFPQPSEGNTSYPSQLKASRPNKSPFLLNWWIDLYAENIAKSLLWSSSS